MKKIFTLLAAVFLSSAAMAQISPNQIRNGFSPNQNAIYLSPICGLQPNCYVTPANTQIVTDATFTSGSPNVATSSADPPFTAGDVHKEAEATYNCQSVLDLTNPEICSGPGCPDTTIKTVTDAHHVVLNANCTNSSTGGIAYNRFAWGNIDDAGIANAKAALQALGHGVIDLPCTALWVETDPFSFATAAPGTNAINGPLAVRGCLGGTLIVPGFNFNYSSCPANGGCIYNDPNVADNGNAFFSDAVLRDVNVQGLGIDGASAVTSTGLGAINVNAQQSFEDVEVAGWNWNASNGFAAFIMAGGTVRGGGPQAGGTWGFRTGGSFPGGLIIGVAFANAGGKSAVRVDSGGLTIIGAQLYRDGGTNCTGPDQQGVYVTSGSLTLLNDSATEVCQTGGTVALDGFGTFGGDGAYVASGGTIYARNASASGTFGAFYLSNTTFYDQGGNTETVYFDNSGGADTFIGSASITGVADVAGNHALTSGWGTANVNTVSGFTTAVTFKVSVTGGSPGSGPVLTDSFPTPASNHISKFFAPPLYCTLTQIAGNTGDISAPIESSLTASGVTWAFTGTPASGHSYTFVRNCYN